MNKIVSRGLWFTVILGGLSLAGVGAANAAEPGTSGDGGVASGDQASLSLNLPITLGGNSVSLLGDSSSDQAATDSAAAAPAASAPTTSGDDSVAGGADVPVSVSVPVNIGGTSVSLLGDSSSSGADTSNATTAGSSTSGSATTGDDSVAGGTNLPVSVSAPVTVGGNSVSLLGDSSSSDAMNTNSTDNGAAAGDQDAAATSGDDGILGGILAPIGAQAPVTVGGNAISVLGDSSAEGAATSSSTGGTAAQGDNASTSGEDGILGGLLAPIGASVPVTVSGDAISVVGDSSTSDASTGVQSGQSDDNPTTSGDGGLLSGALLPIDLGLPITIGGDAISVIGDSTTTGSTTGVTPTEPTDPGTPTEPTDPGTPTEPTDPGTPTEPANPVTPSSPMPPVASVTTGGWGVSAQAASGAMLASTGSDVGGVWGLAALLLAVGLGLATVARRVTRYAARRD